MRRDDRKDPLELTPEEIAALPADGRPDYNRLVFEASPYLLQHAANPVDWYPWGEAAFERARAEDRPVFLSIGYATCHWCHVMERESFEDPEVAGLLNRLFVPVKVDREERPDLDQVYMTVTQGLTGSGGWPMTVVLTPERRPFFAGTYFPKEGRAGRPGLLELLPHLAGLWRQQREQVETSAAEITGWLQRTADPAAGPGSGEGGLSPDLLDEAYRELAARFDARWGGFGERPKFPTPHQLTFLLRFGRRHREPHAVTMALRTLDALAAGGIHDHLGGGFHRYATDREWLVPHFEKMLYDQALLADAFLEAYEGTGEARYADLARDIFGYVTRDLALPGGGFAGAEDADSEGVEGKFYLWTAAGIRAVLGDEADRFLEAYGCTGEGNYRDEASGRRTGENILHRPFPAEGDLAPGPGRNGAFAPFGPAPGDPARRSAEIHGSAPDDPASRLAAARARLLEARARWVRPLRDDKVLTDWNGLMIAALARGGRVLGEPCWTEAAQGAADFLWEHLRDPGGRLLRRWRAGRAGLAAVLDDHAFLAWGLLELYRSTFEVRRLAWALELAGEMERRFWDEEGGGFHLTASDAEPLPARGKEIYDGALPSGNAVAAAVLVRLARLTGRSGFEERAERLLRAFARPVTEHPSAHTALLQVYDRLRAPSREVVLVGRPGAPDTEALREVLDTGAWPDTEVVFRPLAGENDPVAEPVLELAPFVRPYGIVDGRAAAYVCRDHLCHAPVTRPEELRARLEEDV
jgi:uncharacterized protein YyaL (SSP411 family)